MEVVHEHWISERQCRVLLRSAALGRAAWVHVLGPPGFGGLPDRQGAAAGSAVCPAAAELPTLLLLHGADADPGSWETGVGIAARCAGLEALVVMPEVGMVGFCTDWLLPERPVAGRVGTTWARRVAPAWERFHLDEVLPWAELRFGGGGRRAVCGVSMGGFGAFSYAARRPGLFGAAASLSGLLDTLGRGMPTFIATMLLRERQHRHALWGSPLLRRDLWESHNPLDLAERLGGIDLYLSRADGRPFAGDPDFPALTGTLERIVAPTTDAMALALSQLGIPATVSHGQGVHMWPTWDRELDIAWPFLLRGLGLGPGVGG